MNNQADFEGRLTTAFAAYAERAPVEVDAATLTSVVARGRVQRRWSFPGRVIGRPSHRVALLLIVLGLTVALAVGAIVAGAIWRSQTRLEPLPSARFNPTGELQPRDGLAAVRLRDGRVLVVGGWNGEADGSQAWLWDPSTGSFTETGRMSTGRSFPIAALLPDGEVLVAGGDEITVGDGANTALSSAEVFDPQTGTFHPTGSMHVSRGYCHCRGFEFGEAVFYGGLRRPTATALSDGRVFIVGGAYPAGGRADIYDPGSGSFATAGNVPGLDRAAGVNPQCNADRLTAASLQDGRVLVKCLDTAFVYDPRTDSSSMTGAPVTDTVGAAVVLADGRVLFTGRGRTLSAGRAEIFDPASGGFHVVTDPTDPASVWPQNPGVVLADGRVVFVDGSATRIFDPATETFARIAGGPLRPRTWATATLLADGRVLIVGPTDPDVPGPQELLDLGRP
jgi:hypothetical protein